MTPDPGFTPTPNATLSPSLNPNPNPIPNPNQVAWQAPLFYHIELDQRPFFVRITAVLRQIFTMGLLIACSINTMSVYRYGWGLGVGVGVGVRIGSKSRLGDGLDRGPLAVSQIRPHPDPHR